MKNLGAKYKIAIMGVVFLLFAVVMFMFGYKIFATRNQGLADSTSQRRLEYEVLQREQKSSEQGKKDLAELENKTYPPTDLFSQDTNVVKEIKTLEDAATKNNIALSLQISGTAKTATKVAGVSSELYTVPYIVTMEGTFTDLMNYVQTTEHMPFVSYTKVMNINAIDDGKVRMVMNSDFYIRKWNSLSISVLKLCQG